MKHYDAIIIGFGKAGKTLASMLAKQGKKVAMVEQSTKMYGGTCINIACIPTKSLAYQANERHYSEAPKETFYKDAIDTKNELTSLLRNKNFHMLDDQESIMVYTATASFLDDHTVQLSSEKEKLTLTADNFFINTGSSPVIPPIDEIEAIDSVYTSTTLQELKKLPEKLAIIGGGYIGLEFASIYANFGSKVTILDHSSVFLSREDRDVAEEVKKVLETKNITIELNSSVQAVTNRDGNVVISYEKGNNHEELSSSALLIATGRKPNTEGLGLENTSIEVDDQGAIIVDDLLRTTADHIWAMGDVKGGPQFTYISLDDFRIIRDQFAESGGNYTLKDREHIPDSVFIDPILSHVGLSEKVAKDKGINYKVATLQAAEIPRARIIKQTDGLLKALIDPDTKKILGCTLFCAESSEMINIISIAMKAKLPYTFLRDHIFTHPTMSEALNDLFARFD